MNPFVREMCEDPFDDTVRLVCADWLDENGDPELAEFVRLQVRIEVLERDRMATDGPVDELPAAHARARELCARNYETWCAGTPSEFTELYHYDETDYALTATVNLALRPTRVPDTSMCQLWLRRGFVGRVQFDTWEGWERHGAETALRFPATVWAVAVVAPRVRDDVASGFQYVYYRTVPDRRVDAYAGAVPGAVYDRLTGGSTAGPVFPCRLYQDAAAARADLTAAVTAETRHRAGLPRIPYKGV